MGIVSRKIVLWALLFMTDLMCQQTEILEGDNISLKPKWKENINEIIWTLENNKVAEMNVNGKVRFFKHFEGRAQLNTHTGALNISMVQLKDGGTYICELIVNNGVILQTSIVLLVHPRLEAPQINCVHENTAVLLQCETSSSEPITYNWNFQPCTTNSDDCELKNNNEMITIRNARSYMSQEVYCTVNNSLHSNHSESFLIRNCITDLRDRLWSSIILLTAANSVSIVSVILLHRFVNLRSFVRLVLPVFAVAAAVPVLLFLVLKLGFVNLTVFWFMFAAAGVTSLMNLCPRTMTYLRPQKPMTHKKQFRNSSRKSKQCEKTIRKWWRNVSGTSTEGQQQYRPKKALKESEHCETVEISETAETTALMSVVKESPKSVGIDTQETSLIVVQESNKKELDESVIAKQSQVTVDTVSQESDKKELDESVIAKQSQVTVDTVSQESELKEADESVTKETQATVHTVPEESDIKESDVSITKDTQETVDTVPQESGVIQSDELIAKGARVIVDTVPEESDVKESNESVTKETQKTVDTVPEKSDVKQSDESIAKELQVIAAPVPEESDS